MAAFTPLATTQAYATLLAQIDGMLGDLALGLSSANTTPTSPRTNSIRWNNTNNFWESYNGTIWVPLAATYAINISGTAASASAVPFTGITGRPTTVAGYGITDALTTTAAAASYAALAGNNAFTGFVGSAQYIYALSLGNLGQMQAVGGSGAAWYNSGLRNDGLSVYLLSSAVQSTQASAINAAFNAFRPLAWNLTTGAVTIDGSASGASFGGSVTIPTANITTANITTLAVGGNGTISGALTVTGNVAGGANSTFGGSQVVTSGNIATFAPQPFTGAYTAGTVGTTVTNSSGKPMQVIAQIAGTGTAPGTMTITINGVSFGTVTSATGSVLVTNMFSFIVPPGQTYNVTAGPGTATVKTLV